MLKPSEPVALLEQRALEEVMARLIKALQSSKLTQRQLARRLDVKEARISQLLRGSNMTLKTLVRLAAAVDCKVDIALRASPLARQHNEKTPQYK